MVLAMLKLSGHIKDLLMADLAKGTAGELTSIVMWGNSGRIRSVQIWIGGYLLLTYSAFLVMVLIIPDGILPAEFEEGCAGCNDFAQNNPAPTELVIGAFVAGCVGYILSIYQIFLLDSRRKIENLELVFTGN